MEAWVCAKQDSMKIIQRFSLKTWHFAKCTNLCSQIEMYLKMIYNCGQTQCGLGDIKLFSAAIEFLNPTQVKK
jgi:hypothetical protein